MINQRIGRIKRLFRYGVAEELVPSSVFQALQAVEGLRIGRTEAREIAPIEPISDDQMELLIPFLSSVTAAMVRLQRLTGMRPGEVCQMRAVDIDRSGEVWLYRPATHKTQWRGKSRIVPLGPKAQAVLEPFLDRPDEAYLFTPYESYCWFRDHPVSDNKTRKTPVYPSELKRRQKQKESKAVKRFRDCFNTESYDQSIRKSLLRAQKAGIIMEKWSPNQLRHTKATELRRTDGLEAAQVILGHAKADVTQIYAERNLNLAIRIAKETG